MGSVTASNIFQDGVYHVLCPVTLQHQAFSLTRRRGSYQIRQYSGTIVLCARTVNWVLFATSKKTRIESRPEGGGLFIERIRRKGLICADRGINIPRLWHQNYNEKSIFRGPGTLSKFIFLMPPGHQSCGTRELYESIFGAFIRTTVFSDANLFLYGYSPPRVPLSRSKVRGFENSQSYTYARAMIIFANNFWLHSPIVSFFFIFIIIEIRKNSENAYYLKSIMCRIIMTHSNCGLSPFHNNLPWYQVKIP